MPPPVIPLSTQVVFEGIEANGFLARMWRIPGGAPGSDGPFTALPLEAHTLRIAKDSLFINRFTDDVRVVYPLSKVKEWGAGPHEELRIVYARATDENGTRYCLRFVFDAKNTLHKNLRFLEGLIADARFHALHLPRAAGIIVPHNFGLWTMNTGPWAGIVLFSLTQWCGTPWATLRRTDINTPENKLLIGRTLEILHDLGVQLNGSMGDDRDYCQVLIDTDNPKVSVERHRNGRARCFMVGFSEASLHQCRRKLPLLPIGCNLLKSPRFGCDELSNASVMLGFMRPSAVVDGASVVDNALRWHEQYSTNFPEYKNSAILIAQRAALFSHARSLYPALTVKLPIAVDAPLELSDGGQTFVDPTVSIEDCTRSELGYKLWTGGLQFATRSELGQNHRRRHHNLLPTTTMPRSEFKLAFEALEPKQFTARRWHIPDVDGPFRGIHDDVDILHVPNKALFLNNYVTNNRVVLPFKELHDWGLEDETRLIYARALAPNGQRFCLRFVFNADKGTSTGEGAWALTGILVPRHYGIWMMNTGSWAGVVLFSVTEWCGVPWKTLMGTKLDTPANRLLVARTLETFHDLGFQLNPTRSTGNPEGFCQVLLNIDEPGVTVQACMQGRTRCFVVGFANAEHGHDCRRKLPLLPIGFELVKHPNIGCTELSNAAILLGFSHRSIEPETSLQDAIKWHDEFSALHPSYPNSSVLLAQRHALYPCARPLYPGLTLSGSFAEDPAAELQLSDPGHSFIDPEVSSAHCTMEDLEYRFCGRAFEKNFLPVVQSTKPSSDSAGSK
ncbi:hypothetical protein HMN09_00753800 [Mycena chlorophos]|uniref:Uncharacterized protein n=1 Tax=Mycena chlorophos TaxID=658473 RepID=A0A8H6SVD9_MYCCL|nr:hypothetical protein HMN09_00753800 [Mycena chlorophos]